MEDYLIGCNRISSKIFSLVIMVFNSFLVNNIEYNVPCVFQIWEKKIFNRIHNFYSTKSKFSEGL